VQWARIERLNWSFLSQYWSWRQPNIRQWRRL